MAEIPSVYKFVILFALVAYNAFIYAEGRQIKSMNKEDNVVKESKRKTTEGRSINLQSAAEREQDFHPSRPSSDHITGADHNIAGKKQIFPPISFRNAADVYKDDFRPTTPGNSPGVGHKHGKLEEDDFRPTTPGNSPGVGHRHGKVEEDDFRPTTPGNSLGVGHKHGKVEEDDFLSTTPGNSPGVGHKHGKMEEDDFRPTTPGNSPGVGLRHAEGKQDVESKVQGDHRLSSAEHTLTGFHNDFGPTTPGHSPGVGHSDFQHKPPGHSPGVGHSLSNKKVKPKA